MLALGATVHRDRGTPRPAGAGGAAIAVIAFYRSVNDQYGKQAGHSLDDAAGFDRLFRRVAGRRNLYDIWILDGVVGGAPLAALWGIAAQEAVTAAIHSTRGIILLARLDRSPAPGSPR